MLISATGLERGDIVRGAELLALRILNHTIRSA
jgi:hypothetical protein